MLPRWIVCLIAAAALIGAVSMWLVPVPEGPYSATHGPVTALRARQAAQSASLLLLAAATALAGVISLLGFQIRISPLAEDLAERPRPQPILEFDCIFLC